MKNSHTECDSERRNERIRAVRFFDQPSYINLHQQKSMFPFFKPTPDEKLNATQRLKNQLRVLRAKKNKNAASYNMLDHLAIVRTLKKLSQNKTGTPKGAC